ncbi:MAG: flagellar basal body L-ring protein FlgH [Tepidisphaeraceae bacterium]|jgi:flagellar L-ring protein precursor FlgH
MLSIRKAAGAFMFCLAFTAAAYAQTATPDSSDSQSASAIPAPPPIGELSERAGGSLARATMNSRSDTEVVTAPMTAASYIAVPDPPPKLLHKHDLVTIIVNEQSAYTAQGDNNLQKAADFDSQVADYIHMNSHNSLEPEQPSNPLEFKWVGSRDLKGSGEVDRTDSLTARITAEVVDVKPNGTLVLQASETIKTDDETQKMSLSGTCRVDDISADNSILSTQLYDLHLTKDHTGQIRDTTKRGFFPRLLDWIDPF